jgi:hypothetical protein
LPHGEVETPLQVGKHHPRTLLVESTTGAVAVGREGSCCPTAFALRCQEPFDFLGYTVGRLYGMEGRRYIGTRPSRKSVKSLLRRIPRTDLKPVEFG